MSDAKTPTWFWIVAVAALLWNLLGLAVYLMTVFAGDAMIEQMPQEQKDLFLAAPSWVNWANAVAVFSGVLGSLWLVLRRGLSVPLLIISLIAVLIHNGYWMFGTDALSLVGGFDKVMSFMVPLLALLWVVVATKAKSGGWLR